LNKIISTKNIISLFLACILITGTIAALFPSSFFTQVNAQSEYGLMKSGDDYNSKYLKNHKENIIDCNNINLNANGQVNGIIPESRDLIEAQGQTEGDSEIGSSGYGIDEKRFGYDKKDFIFKCVNNNNNEKPIDGTGTLTVIKTVDCQTGDVKCPDIDSSFFTIFFIEGNNPSRNNFPGSPTPGTNVELGLGPYRVSEAGLQTPTPHVCSREGYEAGRAAPDLGPNLFICTNFSDECKGNISPGSTQTCEIRNVVVFCEDPFFENPDQTNIQSIQGFSNPKDIAYDLRNHEMYVVNQGAGNVIRINAAANPPVLASGINPIPLPPGSFPFGIAYDHEHFRMYVTNSEGGNGLDSVSVIDTDPNSLTYNTVIKTIGIPGTQPFDLAYDPEHDEMYVTNLGGNTVYRIDAVTLALVDNNTDPPNPITVENAPWGIDWDETHFMYVTNFGSGSVSVIDTNTNTVIDANGADPGNAIQVGNGPTDITFDPDLLRMYVTNFSEGSVSVIDVDPTHTLTYNTVIDRIPPTGSAFESPVYITYDPVCKDMWVTNQDGTEVSIINTDTNEVIKEIPGFTRPIGIAYDPDQHRMYVANSVNPGTVSVINLCGCPTEPGLSGGGTVGLTAGSFAVPQTNGATIPTGTTTTTTTQSNNAITTQSNNAITTQSNNAITTQSNNAITTTPITTQSSNVGAALQSNDVASTTTQSSNVAGVPNTFSSSFSPPPLPLLNILPSIPK
jgi:YVTN family beta-propeller protein